jgi:hypothetical protein
MQYESLIQELSFRSAAVSREESAVWLAETDSSPKKPARNDNKQKAFTRMNNRRNVALPKVTMYKETDVIAAFPHHYA